MCDRFPLKFDVQTSYKLSNYVLGLIFVVNIKFPGGTYHTIVPSTEELYCLTKEPIHGINNKRTNCFVVVFFFPKVPLENDIEPGNNA